VKLRSRSEFKLIFLFYSSPGLSCTETDFSLAYIRSFRETRTLEIIEDMVRLPSWIEISGELHTIAGVLHITPVVMLLMFADLISVRKRSGGLDLYRVNGEIMSPKLFTGENSRCCAIDVGIVNFLNTRGFCPTSYSTFTSSCI